MSDATSRRLKVSREGVVLIKSFEGFHPRAVRAEDGRWVIGYGHTASARDGLTVTEADAELLLQYDLLPVVKALNDQVSTPLNQHQFDALASFAISVGVERFLASDVLQRLNAGRPGEAADALINWPEETPPDTRLRRRAAERALFVADPDAPVHLADLLAAPLPPPPVVESAAQEADAPPVETPPDARAAAVAALLGEAPAPTPAPEPEPQPEPSPEPVPLRVSTPVTTIHLQRYSAYASPMIGPLPGFPAPVLSAPTAAAEPAPGAGPEPMPEPEPAPAVPSAEPVAEPESAQEPQALGPVPPEPAPEPFPPLERPPLEPVAPLVPPAPGASPFPQLDEPLVLTPPSEADFVEPARPVWEPEQRIDFAVQDEGDALFDDEPAGPVMRHETEPEPSSRRFDWSVKGAYAIMGLTGLAACAFSAAAFRLAMTDRSPFNDYTVIGWVLALIGVVCVSVASWKLFVQGGRRD